MAFPHLFKKFLFLIFIGCIGFFSISHFQLDDNNNSKLVSDYHVSSLLNLTNFKYLLKTEQCRKYKRPLLGIFVVISPVQHHEIRMAHRYALPQCRLGELGFQRIFLIGDIPPTQESINQPMLVHEQSRFGDLLQGNFFDVNRNSSYKHIMGLRWASHECRMAKFIIKVNDNVIYDIYFVQNYLNALLENEFSLATSNQFLSGLVIVANKPLRDPKVEWYAKPEEFTADIYPYYLSGGFYVTNPLTAARLAHEAAKASYFWIDNVWVTGIIRHRLEILVQGLFAWAYNSDVFLDCCDTKLVKHGYNCYSKLGMFNINKFDTLVNFQSALEMCYNYDI
ncbi:N-acetyllactosaminide beta-1,3-N-acetylglucosaminyltransferase 2-like isoform X1 [Teleopsis dalmanni]|uniref:N-acetyllactosaminide beta-1,3-N-acetylglucosaminyltransferase 2-like isoform X1 n=1 Tax=Teleopsis dalmanni TaxID=139649 RepID=UPI0018CF4A0E|nr:N-acetyllactosaminide beta-1,3-N-acetylglucosaminyltransferase 2-like isoform X1 [Teleopsis dalmanni]